MEELVYQQNGEAVTDSVTVADMFDKQHKDVLRDIRNLDCSFEFSQRNFAPSTYRNERGREYECVIIKQDGFSFLVMSYTGKKAAAFKELFISKFNEMRETIQNQVPVLDERTALIESLKMTAETAERTQHLEASVQQLSSKVDNQITLDHGEQRRLQKAVSIRIYDLTEDKDERKRLFRQAYRDIKDRFGVGSYKDVKRKDLEAAVSYITHWIPKQVA